MSRVQRERIGGERERGKDQDQQEGLRVDVTVFCRKKPQALVSFLCWFIAHSNFILYRLHWLTKNFAPLSVYFSLFFSEYTYICTWKYSSSLSPLFFFCEKEFIAIYNFHYLIIEFSEKKKELIFTEKHPINTNCF